MQRSNRRGRREERMDEGMFRTSLSGRFGRVNGKRKEDTRETGINEEKLGWRVGEIRPSSTVVWGPGAI